MRRQTKRGTVNHGDTLRIEQIVDHVFIVIEDRARWCFRAQQTRATGVNVERAFRRVAMQTRRVIKHFHHQVAALLEHRIVLRDEILWAIQGFDCRRLADGRRVRGALRLDIAHRLDKLLRAPGIADAPASHAIGLGDAIHGQGTVVQRGLDLCGCGEFEIVIHQVLIYIVGQHPDMRMAHQHLGNRFQFAACIGRTARVGWGIEQHPFGFERDRRLEIGRAQFETVFLWAGHDHRRTFGQQYHFRIRNPVGRRDDDLITRRQRGHEGVVQHLLAAGADGNLFGCIRQAILALELGNDRFLQLGGAIDSGVFGVTGPDRLDRGLFHIVRCIEVRFAKR